MRSPARGRPTCVRAAPNTVAARFIGRLGPCSHVSERSRRRRSSAHGPGVAGGRPHLARSIRRRCGPVAASGCACFRRTRALARGCASKAILGGGARPMTSTRCRRACRSVPAGVTTLVRQAQRRRSGPPVLRRRLARWRRSIHPHATGGPGCGSSATEVGALPARCTVARRPTRQRHMRSDGRCAPAMGGESVVHHIGCLSSLSVARGSGLHVPAWADQAVGRDTYLMRVWPRHWTLGGTPYEPRD